MLELKNITKSYNNKTILNNLNLKVEDDSILSIVGPSGAGKTTLLRCIAGLENIDSGTFLIDGKPFDPTKDKDVQPIVGVVFQDFNLFPHLSVIENVALAPQMVLKQNKKDAIEKAAELLTYFDLIDNKDQYPSELSGGQKQRVAIARALAMQPKILCYDEPTSALDPSLRDVVGNYILKTKNTGLIQIIITHDPAFAEKISDQILKVQPIK
ncbi:amino acid ABC transporter ATP-binding protein [Lactobacillus terrae]|uniref:amino acid ABC transporter ATP-binding protein n=1 Tax=Lactobacillus terrae TaxID=2269374 RepID=UPI000C1B601C|nr:ATP-binding cassette domain-containing protein [Lactobacillus terrae]